VSQAGLPPAGDGDGYGYGYGYGEDQTVERE
jgi:hypothetical protein